MIRKSNPAIIVTLAVLAFIFTIGSASADSQEQTKKITLLYTGNTLGSLDPCPT